MKKLIEYFAEFTLYLVMVMLVAYLVLMFMSMVIKLFTRQIMTEKEKAKELLDKYSDKSIECNEGTEWTYDKECALICIDEILESYNALEYYPEELRNYWQDVKQEINKL